MNIFLLITEIIKAAGLVLLLIGAIQIERRLIRIERSLRAANENRTTADDLPREW